MTEKKLGLSLSGGGYRAAAYHLGTLKKLHEMKILENVKVLSTVSGGSITGACYCLHTGDSTKSADENFKVFDDQMRKSLQQSVIKRVLRSWIFIRLVLAALIVIAAVVWLLFTPYAWASPVSLIVFLVVLVSFQFRIFPVSKTIEKIYDQLFFNKKKLKDLCSDKPLMAINATNLETARPFTFSSAKMGDSTYAFYENGKEQKVFNHEEFPVARAVMASSCVPFAFTPVEVKGFFVNEEMEKKYRPRLVDGGVYDNQGIHKLTQPESSYRCNVIITSDAGAMFPFQSIYPNVLGLLIRTMDIFMQRIKNFQMVQNIYENYKGKDRQVAYHSLGWDVKKSIPEFIRSLTKGDIIDEVSRAHHITDQLINRLRSGDEATAKAAIIEATSLLEARTNYKEIEAKSKLIEQDLPSARNIGTNLTALTKAQIDLLSAHAELMTELQVRLYCPGVVG